MLTARQPTVLLVAAYALHAAGAGAGAGFALQHYQFTAADKILYCRHHVVQAVNKL